MKNHTATGYRPVQRLTVSQIPGYHFYFQLSNPAGCPGQRSYAISA